MENQNERDEIEIDLVELFYVLWGYFEQRDEALGTDVGDVL